jgi:hypothetical protein
LGTPLASSLESSSCFLPSVGVDPCDELIQLSPSSCSGGFLVNGIGSMVGSMWWPTEAEAIYRETPRSKGIANRARKPLGRSDWVGRPRPFLGQFGPIFVLAGHLGILDIAPLMCVILWSSSPRSRYGVFSRLKSSLVWSFGSDFALHSNTNGTPHLLF